MYNVEHEEAPEDKKSRKEPAECVNRQPVCKQRPQRSYTIADHRDNRGSRKVDKPEHPAPGNGSPATDEIPCSTRYSNRKPDSSRCSDSPLNRDVTPGEERDRQRPASDRNQRRDTPDTSSGQCQSWPARQLSRRIRQGPCHHPECDPSHKYGEKE